MTSGEPRWQYNIGGDTFNYLLGAPVQVGSSLYFLSQQGDVIALDATDGTLQWQLETSVAGARDGLTVAGGRLFIGDGEGNVYAYAGQ
jgi:outer membrane protein assembly factor BamB